MDKSLEYIDKKIFEISNNIDRLIEENLDDRDYMSKNILSDLRYLLEYCFFRVYIVEKVQNYLEFNHENNRKSIQYIKSRADFRELRALHGFLQISTSHSLPNGDGSSRVLIKYLNYLIILKEFMDKTYKIKILNKLYYYPLNIEKNMEKYYKQVSVHVNSVKYDKSINVLMNQYYVHKVKPIIIDGNVFYEITLTDATDYINKFNRIVVYSRVKVMDNYAIKVSTVNRTISLFDKSIDIKIINNYTISIRPCELNNFSKIFGLSFRISSKHGEYEWLMQYLKNNNCSLLDIVELSESNYNSFYEMYKNSTNTQYILSLLDRARHIIVNGKNGANILRFLLFNLNNVVIKDQLFSQQNSKLSDLYLCWESIPFDDMPYASSLYNHKIDISDLLQCIDYNERDHELLSRRICYSSDSLGDIYLNRNEFDIDSDKLTKLINKFNSRLYYKHKKREIIEDKDYIYVYGYEKDTILILKQLIAMSEEKYDDYDNLFTKWYDTTDYIFFDDQKKLICADLFKDSKVSLIFGSAGCGKTETINIISKIFSAKKIVFLAKTNPAIENLRRRIGEENQNFEFLTIDKYKKFSIKCDLLIIDECSTVDNYDMNYLLSCSNDYELLLLVGDIYQIESIKFGNWFRFAKELLPSKCIFELNGNFRTSDPVLQKLWHKVRNMDVDIVEYLSDNDMSNILDKKIFERNYNDEIILCLNYDGPYGINSINRYLQADNPNKAYEWGINSYKVGDPILFTDLNRFYPVLYNNLKGKIVGINIEDGKIIFDVLVETCISNLDAFNVGLHIIERDSDNTVVRFSVMAYGDDDIEDKKDCVVPFVVAYATSIHKSQGLEYKSVKVVLNDEIGDVITHNIFYTAITRAKEKLRIFWTPECMNKIVGNFQLKNNNKDINILKNKL